MEAQVIRVLIENPLVLGFVLFFLSICLCIMIIFSFFAVKSVQQGRGVNFWKFRIDEDKTKGDKIKVASSNNDDDDAKSEKAEEIYKIEGIWGDWSGTMEEPRVSFVRIRRNDEGFVINGEEYDENYKQIGTWASDVSKFRKRTRLLDYLFEANGSFTDKEVVKMNGYTTINFSGDIDKRPNAYSGTFIDVINPATGELRSGSFDGRRLTDAEKMNYLGEPEAKRLIIDTLIRNARIRAKARSESDLKNNSKKIAEEWDN